MIITMSNIRKKIFIAIMMVVIGSGCGPLVKNPAPLTSISSQASAPVQEYRIKVGDEMDIKFFYNSELNEHLSVRPDGRISLQLIGEVPAVGLTPAELTASLKNQYADQLSKPEVTVIVKTFSQEKVFVDGEVNQPGLRDIHGTTTLRQCIALSGGLKDTARIKEIIVIRQRPHEKPIITVANLEKVNDGTDFSQDITLMPYDIVYVPKSPVANMNRWVEQYIQKMMPVTGASFLPLFLN